jgi:5'-3' exonuclease
MDIDVLCNSIKNEMNNGKSTQTCIHDYVFMCFLLGNDFLPHFPCLNIRTHGFQILLDTYFKVIGKYQSLDIETVYVSPKHKLKLMDKYPDIVVSDKHKQNKIDAIFYTTHLLTNIDEFRDNDIMNIINANKKKDDLCDAYLMCVYYYITNEK